MARYTEAKCKLCRREREKLFLKGLRCYTEKCGFERRRYPPGIHGESRRTRISIYGLQLREKQKVKRIYGVMESQFRRYFKLARRIGGNTGANFLSLLERRLDNVCYLLGFAYSRSQARQLISHGHILVNGKKLDIPSYIVEEGDTISVKNGSKGIPFIEESVAEREKGGIPGWLSLDKTSLSGKVIKLPSREDITHPINERLIVELYSR